MGQLFEEALQGRGVKPKSLFDEAMEGRGPGGSPDNPIDDEAPDEEIRALRPKVMNVTAGSEHARRVLAQHGYEVKDEGDYNLNIRSKKDGKWYRFDPTKFEPLNDVTDVLGGASNLGAQLVGGAGMGLLTAPTGPGALGGLVLGAAGGSAAEEGARVQLGSRLFGFDPPTGKETGASMVREAGYAAAGEALAPVLKPAFKLAGKALQLPYKAEQKVVDLVARGLGGAATDSGGAPIRHFGKIKFTERVTKESADSMARQMEEESTRILDHLSASETITERMARGGGSAGAEGVDDVLRAIVDQRVDVMTREKAMNDMAFEGKRLWYQWARQNSRRTKGDAWNIADKNADKIFERLHAKRSKLAKEAMEESIRLLKERQPGLSDMGAKKLFAEAESIAGAEARASSSFEQAARLERESASSLAREVSERSVEMPASMVAKVEDQVAANLGGRGLGGFGRFQTERGLYRALMPMMGYSFTSSPFGLWGGVRALNVVGRIVERTPELLQRLVARAPAPIAGRLRPVIAALRRGDKTGAMMSLSLLLKNDAVRDWVEQNLSDAGEAAQETLSAIPGLQE